MPATVNPGERQPKGDHNRRVSLGLDAEQFAAAAGITVKELRDYENTWPDHEFSSMIANRVGEALDRLENVLPNSEAAGIRQLVDGADGASQNPEPTFDQQVRDMAYFMWESEGRPDGRDQEYWHRARATCLGQRALDRQYAAAVGEPNSSSGDPTYRVEE